ncbi:MAG: hypothetical protein HQL95_13725 [Magnetococcales bacterium]|nr:hypothetical protein [Magnetococcales bacterium]
MNATLDAMLLGMIFLGCLVYLARRARGLFDKKTPVAGCRGCGKSGSCGSVSRNQERSIPIQQTNL